MARITGGTKVESGYYVNARSLAVVNLAGDVGEGAKDLAATLAPGHAVGEAHLTGKPGEGTKVEDEELEKLGKEIEEKREKKE